MNLSASELQALLLALSNAFPNRSKFRMLLRFPPIEKQIENLTSETETLDVQYFEVLERANAEGWIETLFDGLRAGTGVNPDLIALIDGMVALRKPVAATPAHLALLLDSSPFVNHRQLRDTLFSIVENAGPKVLQVTGGPISGKTYSENLIRHIARGHKITVFGRSTIEATLTATTLAEDIVIGLGLAPLPTVADDPGDAQTVQRYVRWITAQMQQKPGMFWLIFDGFESDSVHDSVQKFISALAQSVGKGDPDNVRLFLLAWTRPISGTPPGRILEETLTPFERAHVKTFLDDIVSTYAMPDGFGSTDELVEACYAGSEQAKTPMAKAETLTKRIYEVCVAARAAQAGGGV